MNNLELFRKIMTDTKKLEDSRAFKKFTFASHYHFFTPIITCWESKYSSTGCAEFIIEKTDKLTITTSGEYSAKTINDMKKEINKWLQQEVK